MDRIRLEGIEVFAHHGVLPEERERGQTFVVDVALDVDLAAAAAADDLALTVDYGTLAARVAEVAGGGPHDLIETVAQRVADACLEDERVAGVEVTVHKPQAPLAVTARDVAVTVRRSRPGGAG